MLNNGHNAVQSNSRSLTLAPIERLYTTSYWRLALTYIISCIVSKLLRIIGQIFAIKQGFFKTLAQGETLKSRPQNLAS